MYYATIVGREDIYHQIVLNQGESQEVCIPSYKDKIQRQVGNEGNVNGNAPPLQVQGQVQQGHNQAQVSSQFNVGILEVVHEVDEDDEVDVFANKRTRTQRSESEGHIKEERARAKLRRDEDKGKAPMEEGESSKQAKARARRRKIGMDDFQLGKGQPAYDFLENLKNKKADISYGQLLHLSSSMRRHWHKLASIRRVKVKLPHAHVVQLHKVTDVLPVFDAWIHGRRVNKAYMDGGAQVCVMIEETMQQLGLELTGKSMFSVKMANSSRVKCLGVIHDLEINVLGQWAVMDIHIIHAKLGAYPVILGRPWLIAMRSWQDWYRGCIDLFVDRPKDKRIRYDMNTCKVLEIDDEPSMHQDLSSAHDMYDSYSSASSTCTDDEVYDQSLLDLDVDLCEIHVSTKSGEKEGAENSKIHHEADHEPNYPSDNAKLQKWLLNLQQFDMSFIKEDSVRANMADMLTFKEINVKNDMKKYLERKIVPSPTMHEELQDVEGTLYFDGAFRRSINKGAAGYVFFDKNGVEGWFGSQEVDVKSNNEAEYASFCVGLNECIKRHVKKLVIKGDSMLVIRQIQGTWKVNKEGMKGWFFKVRRLLKFFHVYQIWYVPRNMNMRAHELAKQVFVKDVHVVAIKEPRYLGRESLYEEEHVLQMGFARKGLSSQQRHAITRRAMKYVIIGEHLYHKGVDGVMRRVLYQDEVFDCLKACHGKHVMRKDVEATLEWKLQEGKCWMLNSCGQA
ncbi:hypothetical protein L7F22_065382 [Adiantum nelumboides]|nr:hypothetical protein [Adiantum nelumboides]